MLLPAFRLLNATWLHGHRQPAWMEMEAVDQLFIMNCFVSRGGWAELADPLARLLTSRRAGEIRVYLSLEGATSVGRSQFCDDLVEFFGRHRAHVVGERPPLQVFFVRDQFGSLFHPKAYALRRGQRFLVSVGSANATRSAHRSNYEMELHSEDPETYHEFVDAVQMLEASKVTRRFKIPTEERLRELQKDHEVRRRALSRALGPRDGDPASDHSKLLEPMLEEAPDVPISSDVTEALAEIKRAMMVGCRLVDQGLGLPNLSVSLRPFVNAKILVHPERRTIIPGMTLGDGTVDSLLISLVPDGVIEAMKTINKRHRYLLQQFSIDLLGIRWMPIDWERVFLSHWMRCRSRVSALPLAEVDRHLAGLQDGLSSQGFVDGLARGLRLQTDTAQWKTKSAERLLADPGVLKAMGRRIELSEKMQADVFAEIAEHIRGRVMGKLDRDMARFQVERVGSQPRCDEAPRTSFQDALDFVATMSATLIHGIHEKGAGAKELSRSGGTGVQRALAKFARNDPHQRMMLRDNVLRLRRQLTDRTSASEAALDQLLVAAWRSLKGVFDGGQFPQDWSGVVPQWSPSWLNDEEAPQ